jgi:hypothetical protein
VVRAVHATEAAGQHPLDLLVATHLVCIECRLQLPQHQRHFLIAAVGQASDGAQDADVATAQLVGSQPHILQRDGARARNLAHG